MSSKTGLLLRLVVITLLARGLSSAAPAREASIANFHQVEPGLYRSAQPDAAGMKELRRRGIRTVINLRAWHSDDDEARGSGLTLERWRMSPWRPREADLAAVVARLRGSRQPVLVHCRHGADRTGLVIALHRVINRGLSPEAARREMTEGPYGFHRIFRGLLRHLEPEQLVRLRAMVEARGAVPVNPPAAAGPSFRAGISRR